MNTAQRLIAVLLEQPVVPELFHGTSTAHLSRIRAGGLANPCLVDDVETAAYYAGAEVDEALGDPIILRVRVPDTNLLRADFASFEEPLSFTLQRHKVAEDDWFEKLNDPNSGISWPADDHDWQTSLRVVGAVRYAGILPPGVITNYHPGS